jgi:hypothetical protein
MKHYINPTTKEVFAYELDGSQDHIIASHLVPISDADLETLRAEKTAALEASLTYAEKRVREYPPIEEQLDAFWKGGTAADEMKAKIVAVKNKYPKE